MSYYNLVMKANLMLLLIIAAEGRLCPNKRDSCPEFSTCCPMRNSEREGCCPYKNAQCCSDFIHCCPSGSVCNVEGKSCDNQYGNVSLKWMVPLYHSDIVMDLHKPSKIAKSKDNPCPDGNSCPLKSTCCKTPQGNYGCCPYKNANCCSDGEHCCPDSFQCDLKHSSCVKPKIYSYSVLNSVVLPMYNIVTKKFEGEAYKKTFPEAQNAGIVCPDTIDSCPSGNTCCQMESGRYGCCPMPKATCCEDKLTCCPNGYSCTGDGCKRLPLIDLLHLPLYKPAFNVKIV